MSAPSIPNLLSLRGTGRGGGRGRSRGRGEGGRGGINHTTSSSSTPNATHDSTIQGTDTDASISRLSAVELGYLSDPYAGLFVQRQPQPPAGPGITTTSSSPVPRRLPIINRGTYTRTIGIDTLINQFLSSTDPTQPRQILSLGAGTDTRSFRLFTCSSPIHNNISYHEIDFPTMITKKQFIIRTNPSLSSILSPISTNPPLSSPLLSSSISYSYHPNPSNTLTLHPLDLRSLVASSPPLPNLLPDRPTLIISECCLCYLSPETTSSILAHLSRLLPSSALVVYEPILPDDPFGKMMVSNLAARGIAMPTLSAYPTPESQEQRLRTEGGFAQVRSKTVDKIWDDWIDQAEKERIDELEGGLDEVEEWKLLAGHYLIVWGGKGRDWRGGVGVSWDGEEGEGAMTQYDRHGMCEAPSTE